MSGTPSAHAADIAFIRILQGRCTAAEAVFAELPPTSREDRAATTGSAATRALIALLRNDDAGARAHIDAAIAAQKAGTRRRNVFPDSRAFALSLLALVRMDTPECADLLQRLLKAADRLEIARQAEIRLVLNALQSRHEDGFYGRGPEAGPVSTSCSTDWPSAGADIPGSATRSGARHCWNTANARRRTASHG